MDIVFQVIAVYMEFLTLLLKIFALLVTLGVALCVCGAVVRVVSKLGGGVALRRRATPPPKPTPAPAKKNRTKIKAARKQRYLTK